MIYKAVLFIPLFLFSLINSLYDIQVETVENNQIALASLQGKKIIVSPVNAGNPDISLLKELDSLQQNDTSLVIIAAPANDLGNVGDDSLLLALKDSLQLNIYFLKSSLVKKGADSLQNPLFKWLTHAGENGHFDGDVSMEGQMFYIDDSGQLYGIIDKNVPDSVTTILIDQN